MCTTIKCDFVAEREVVWSSVTAKVVLSVWIAEETASLDFGSPVKIDFRPTFRQLDSSKEKRRKAGA
jgi:hypothetical protein